MSNRKCKQCKVVSICLNDYNLGHRICKRCRDINISSTQEKLNEYDIGILHNSANLLVALGHLVDAKELEMVIRKIQYKI